MLKKMLIVTAAAAVVGLAALPLQVSTAAADTNVLTCRDAAKMKYPDDRKARHDFRRACKEAWRAQKNAATPA